MGEGEKEQRDNKLKKNFGEKSKRTRMASAVIW